MKHLLAQLLDGTPLDVEQAIEAFDLIMTGEAPPAQTGALLALIETRGPSVEEIVGAATVMRRKLRAVTVPDGQTLVDTCGTGGTKSTFFNISTAAAIVTAAAGRELGIGVAKHGNRSVTSRSGSAQVFEALGVKIQVQPQTLTRCLEDAGICFCFAPAHHPAMRHAGPVRQQLGFRTIFNLVGPLTNPARANRQLLGVASKELTGQIAEVLDRLHARRALVVHSVLPTGQPLGELTTLAPAEVTEVHDGTLRSYELDPASLGLKPPADAAAISIDGPEASAAIIRGVLDGENGPARDIVRLNAAAALMAAGGAADLSEGLQRAAEAIDSGTAKKGLERMAQITQEDPTGRG
ncbi:MAG: anthranilate phosphoribosyltransferase [Phycisphaeraceae bacterium]